MCASPSFGIFSTTLLQKIVIPALIINYVNISLVIGYSCETPKEWLDTAVPGQMDNRSLEIFLLNNNSSSEDNDTTAAVNFRQGIKWPGGIVKYKLHSSLTTEDIVEVQKAFDEYHRKTCIRFQPWTPGDISYTSIEMDNNVCGRGHVCMRGGYQYAKFGGQCRKMDTMIHELGHNLCMDHEQRRPDRDEWINFEECSAVEMYWYRNWKQSNPINGMYDYYSQMHYECGSCQGGWPNDKTVDKCGSQITTGLSLLDADHLNEMYDCQGCYRHRWKTLQFLTAKDREHMHSFGYTDINGYPIYPCRGFRNGQIAIGKYIHELRKCFVPSGGVEHELTKHVQILIIPGGLEQIRDDGNVTNIYKLVSIRSISMEEVAKIGIPAGRTVESTGGLDAEGVGFIAFGTLKVNSDENGNVIVDSIGQVWRRRWEDYPVAHFPVSAMEYRTNDNFKVLVCTEK